MLVSPYPDYHLVSLSNSDGLDNGNVVGSDVSVRQITISQTSNSGAIEQFVVNNNIFQWKSYPNYNPDAIVRALNFIEDKVFIAGRFNVNIPYIKLHNRPYYALENLDDILIASGSFYFNVDRINPLYDNGAIIDIGGYYNPMHSNYDLPEMTWEGNAYLLALNKINDNLVILTWYYLGYIYSREWIINGFDRTYGNTKTIFIGDNIIGLIYYEGILFFAQNTTESSKIYAYDNNVVKLIAVTPLTTIYQLGIFNVPRVGYRLAISGKDNLGAGFLEYRQGGGGTWRRLMDPRSSYGTIYAFTENKFIMRVSRTANSEFGELANLYEFNENGMKQISSDSQLIAIRGNDISPETGDKHIRIKYNRNNLLFLYGNFSIVIVTNNGLINTPINYLAVSN
jgi:hypothetical protein